MMRGMGGGERMRRFFERLGFGRAGSEAIEI
jgi:hypothetical protein